MQEHGARRSNSACTKRQSGSDPGLLSACVWTQGGMSQPKEGHGSLAQEPTAAPAAWALTKLCAGISSTETCYQRASLRGQAGQEEH